MPVVAGKDRRGLAEIVSISTLTLVIGGVLIAQLATGHEASHELMAILLGLAAVVTGRGVQSAMERGASAEIRNFEARELQIAADMLRREAEEMRRTNDLNRMMALAAPQQKDKG